MSNSVIFSLFALFAYTQAALLNGTINAAFFPDSSCTGTLSSYELNDCTGPVTTNTVNFPYDFVFSSANNQGAGGLYALTTYNTTSGICQRENHNNGTLVMNACNTYEVNGVTYFVKGFVSSNATSAPTTSAPTTAAPTTAAPTTAAPTTAAPTTAAPTTAAPTTAAPTTAAPTTAAPTTAAPTTAAPTTAAPTTAAPTTAAPTTAAPTTAAPTTAAPTTSAPTTSAPTTSAPTTSAPTTSAPTTSAPTTAAPTTAAPTTNAPTVVVPTFAPVTTAPTVTPVPTASVAPTSTPTPSPTAIPLVPTFIIVAGTTIYNIGGNVASVNVSGLASNIAGAVLGVNNNNYVVYVIDNIGRVYAVNPTTGASTFQIQMNCTGISSYNGYSFGFNPTVAPAGAIRLISSSAANYRVVLSTGVCIKDVPLFYTTNSPRTSPTPAGVGYTNVVNFTLNANPATTEYIIDTNGSSNIWLSEVTSPNNGNTTLIGNTGLPYASPVEFTTAYYKGTNYGVLITGTKYYIINLANGNYTQVTTNLAVPSSIISFIAPPSNYVFPTSSSTTSVSSNTGTTSVATGTGSGSTSSSTTSGASSVVASFAVIALLVAALV